MKDAEVPIEVAPPTWAPIVPLEMDFGGTLPRPYLQAIDPFRRRHRPQQQQGKGGGGGGGGGSGCSPNFLKAVRFAPDGSCVLATSDDAVVRVFELPHHLIYGDDAASAAVGSKDGVGGGGAGGEDREGWAPCLVCEEGESIYDVAWYPLMYVLFEFA